MMTSSSETLNTKQLSRIGSSSSGDTSGPGSSRGSSGSNSNKGGHNNCNNNKDLALSDSPNSQVGKAATPKTMTERWFLCSQTARTEARLLAILDLISSVAYLIVFGLLAFAIVHHPALVRRYLDEVPENQDIARLLTYGRTKQIFFLSILILRPAVSLIIAIMLFVGAQNRGFGLVKACFFVSIIYITIDIILFIPKTIYTQNGKFYVVTYLVNVIYMLYELWVMSQLKKEVLEWNEKNESEAEPETEDTTVADGEPADA